MTQVSEQIWKVRFSFKLKCDFNNDDAGDDSDDNNEIIKK